MKVTIRTMAAGLAIAAIAAVTMLAGQGARPALASPCGGAPCLYVDAVAGGPVQSAASVGSAFDVDIYASNFTPAPLIGRFNFTLLYDASLLVAGAPTTAGLASAGYDCTFLPASGDLPESDGFSDGNPATGDAFITCASTGAFVGDGPIARISFSSLAAGTSSLTLYATEVDNTVGAEILTCNPVVTWAAGGCHGATVTFAAPPVLPPPPLPPCSVTFAIEGNLVQCADGGQVRFIGVGSPVGSAPGAGWARTVTNWFLAGKTITLETDTTFVDGSGARLAYPHYLGGDGADYNISALLIYIGMARSTPDGTNLSHLDWFNSAQVWARNACWNMWKAGNPWAAESGCA
jgi:hypothetical protein